MRSHCLLIAGLASALPSTNTALPGDYCALFGGSACWQARAPTPAINLLCHRLRATYAALQAQQSWVYHMPGGFNEQALSNVVYAYEKAGMLDRELLQWVFSVASLRLDRRDAPPSFKPQASAAARVRRGHIFSVALVLCRSARQQWIWGMHRKTPAANRLLTTVFPMLLHVAQELCTLLRAAHLDICEPQPFLSKLARIVQTMPWIVRNWSTSELNELSRALGLLQPSLLQQQQQQAAQAKAVAAVQQQQQQHQQQQQVAAAAAALPLLGLSGPTLEALVLHGRSKLPSLLPGSSLAGSYVRQCCARHVQRYLTRCIYPVGPNMMSRVHLCACRTQPTLWRQPAWAATAPTPAPPWRPSCWRRSCSRWRCRTRSRSSWALPPPPACSRATAARAAWAAACPPAALHSSCPCACRALTRRPRCRRCMPCRWAEVARGLRTRAWVA